MLIKQRNKVFDLQSPEGLTFVYVEGKGLGLLTDRNFNRGGDVISFPNTLVRRGQESNEAVQVADDTYLDGEWLTPESFMNHNCNPNTKLDFRPDQPASAYVAVRDISKGEEVTFNYLATEYDMTNKFECTCGSPNCYHHIRGFKHLTREQQEELRPLLLPYLAEKLK